VLALARETGIDQVRLMHHDPRKNDEALDAINAAVTTACPTASLARAREEIVIAS
jgi:hypothetical protein